MEPLQSPKARKSAAYRLGVIILIILAILTGLEYFIATHLSSLTILFVVALIKAAIIVQYYMHISHVFAEEGSH